MLCNKVCKGNPTYRGAIHVLFVICLHYPHMLILLHILRIHPVSYTFLYSEKKRNEYHNVSLLIIIAPIRIYPQNLIMSNSLMKCTISISRLSWIRFPCTVPTLLSGPQITGFPFYPDYKSHSHFFCPDSICLFESNIFILVAIYMYFVLCHLCLPNDKHNGNFCVQLQFT